MILDVLRAQPTWICLSVFALRLSHYTEQPASPPLGLSGEAPSLTTRVLISCSQLLCVLSRSGVSKRLGKDRRKSSNPAVGAYTEC